MEGKKEGRKYALKEERMDGWMKIKDGWMEGRKKERRNNGRNKGNDGWMDG